VRGGKVLRDRLCGDFEAADVRRQEHDAATCGVRGLDKLGADQRGRGRDRPRGRTQPKVGHLEQQPPGFGDRRPRGGLGHARLSHVVLEARPVGGRQRVGQPAERTAQHVQQPQGPAGDPLGECVHLSIIEASPSY
jgi:hypothetical protein